MISLYKLENNLRMLGLEYEYSIEDDELEVYELVSEQFIIIIDVKAKVCMLRTEKDDYIYKSTKGIINELWRQFK